MSILRRYLPILTWGAEYSRRTFANDLIVAAIVTIMLIPQSLAYALLAGLPPQVGLYASMAPLVLYAIFGTSRTLAVGPVAVASLMTAAAAGTVAAQGTPEYLGATIALAAISGLLLVAMGLLRLGFLANFLSHPVISGFITASGIQIAAGQLAPVLGIHAEGENLAGPSEIDGAQPRPDQSLYRGDRLRVAGLSLLGAPQSQAALAPVRAGRTDRGHPGEGGPGRGHRRDHRGRLGLRADRARRQASSARSRRACPSSPCRRSMWRSGRSSSSPRC